MKEPKPPESQQETTKPDPWLSTTWQGNEDAHLQRVLASTYEQRFRWICETYEVLKDTLPVRTGLWDEKRY